MTLSLKVRKIGNSLGVVLRAQTNDAIRQIPICVGAQEFSMPG